MKIAIAPVIHLLHEAPHAILSTHSTQMPGYPYGTAVPLVLDESNQPILLISALAEHTKNLLADSRASLAVIEQGKTSIQEAARVTLLGQAETFTPSVEIVQRYLRYQPEAEQYLQLDFMFFRFNVQRARFIGGVGKMGWIDTPEWRDLLQISGASESKLIKQSKVDSPKNFRILGFDVFGIDYDVDGFKDRHRFEVPQTAEALAGRLPEILPSLT